MRFVTVSRQNLNFTTVSRDRHARFYERVAPSDKIATLLQFRAINTHDLVKGMLREQQNVDFTTVSRDRHARSYEKYFPDHGAPH